MGKGWITILLLLGSNAFMTLAWYGHLKFGNWKPIQKGGLIALILISWGLAFFEYLLQVPANKFGFKGNGGPFSLVELKVLQEVITLVVFLLFWALFFRDQPLRWNHAVALIFLVLAVYFAFRGS